MSRQAWRHRVDGAPLSELGGYAFPPIKKRGRPSKAVHAAKKAAQEAAQAHIAAQIAARVGPAPAPEPAPPSAVAQAMAQNGTASSSPDRVLERVTGAGGVKGAVPREQVLGGVHQGSLVASRVEELPTAAPIPHTEIAPGYDGSVRVRTRDEADEALCKYIQGLMLTDAWTERMVLVLVAEHRRAEHTVRMLANRAAKRIAQPVDQASVHQNLYKRARLVSDIALDNYVSVHEPDYCRAATKALETELKIAGLLPKEAPPVKTPAEMRAALLAALARVDQMTAGPGEESETTSTSNGQGGEVSAGAPDAEEYREG